jgi:hypothetical protein
MKPFIVFSQIIRHIPGGDFIEFSLTRMQRCATIVSTTPFRRSYEKATVT